MDSAIRMTGVTKTFGQMTAVADLDLEVPRGGLYGFIGPNGAGKTTTIRMIMSILFPDAGAVSILGHPSALEAKDRIGYLPEERGLYKRMKVQPFLRYLARLKNADGPELDRRIAGALERVGLGGVESKRCDELSKGMSQKVQFVAATIHGPDLLILDEPFSGLDPVSMRMLRDLILEEHHRGATVLFSTHVMPQAEEICQHVIMVHEGRKVLDADLGAIRSRYDPRSIRFEPLDPGAEHDGADLDPRCRARADGRPGTGDHATCRDGSGRGDAADPGRDAGRPHRAFAPASGRRVRRAGRRRRRRDRCGPVARLAPGNGARGARMTRIFHVALRDFIATVVTKGFIFGLLVMPAILGAFVIVGPRLFNDDAYRIAGEYAVIDPTGMVLPELRAALDPEAVTRRRLEEFRRGLGGAPEMVAQPWPRPRAQSRSTRRSAPPPTSACWHCRPTRMSRWRKAGSTRKRKRTGCATRR